MTTQILPPSVTASSLLYVLLAALRNRQADTARAVLDVTLDNLFSDIQAALAIAGETLPATYQARHAYYHFAGWGAEVYYLAGELNGYVFTPDTESATDERKWPMGTTGATIAAALLAIAGHLRAVAEIPVPCYHDEYFEDR